MSSCERATDARRRVRYEPFHGLVVTRRKYDGRKRLKSCNSSKESEFVRVLIGIPSRKADSRQTSRVVGATPSKRYGDVDRKWQLAVQRHKVGLTSSSSESVHYPVVAIILDELSEKKNVLKVEADFAICCTLCTPHIELVSL